MTSPLISTDVLNHTNHTFSGRLWPIILWISDCSPMTHTDPPDPPRTHLTWPFLHFMTFYTIQTKYFLKPHDTQYPLTHWPLTHHTHRPTKATHLTIWPSESRTVVQRLVFVSLLVCQIFGQLISTEESRLSTINFSKQKFGCSFDRNNLSPRTRGEAGRPLTILVFSVRSLAGTLVTLRPLYRLLQLDSRELGWLCTNMLSRKLHH